MKNKKYIIYNCILLIVLAIIIFILIIRLENKGDSLDLSLAQEKVTDECVVEQIDYDLDYNEITASSAELKLSPNAELIIQKKYDKCNHIINEYAEILPEMVNRNQEEIEDMYTNFTVETFSNNKLVVLKEEKGFCGEHYILKEEEGNIVVYKINENDKESLFEKTSISTEYLTQTDLINLRNGIKIYGREKLNSFLEDYE